MTIPLLAEEGWTRPQEDIREASFKGADGVVRPATRCGRSDHPVCAASVASRHFLMAHPPLLCELCEEGNATVLPFEAQAASIRKSATKGK